MINILAKPLAETSNPDLEFAARALSLAAEGVGLVSPNPLVGCVIVSTRGEVVGEGFYRKDNLVHAEAIALEQAGERARGGTAYVSLEPHAHHGKTPPCTEALISAGITRVVCPIEDPNPLVSGRGFERLRAAGIAVETGLLADEASRINEKFICWHDRQRPFVHLKLAMSLDGRISLGQSVSTRLSGEESSARVQRLRHEHDAILIGANTAVVDDPRLTDRSGKPRLRPLTRVVLDNRLRLPADSSLAATTDENPTLVLTNSIDPEKAERLAGTGVEIVPIAGGTGQLDRVLDELRRRDIQSVLVEGGTAVAGAFVDARLVDKVTLIYAPIIIGGENAPAGFGGSGPSAIADALKLTDLTVTRHGDDIEITGYPQR